MDKQDLILISAYTGYLLAPNFSMVSEFCEKTLGRPIWTHEYADKSVLEEIRAVLLPEIDKLIERVFLETEAKHE